MFKFFRSKPSSFAEKTSAAASLHDSQIRRQAQARLIGALLLVLIGVLGFPLIFDTEPRPLDPSIAAIAQKPIEEPSPVSEPIGNKAAQTPVIESPISTPAIPAPAAPNSAATAATPPTTPPPTPPTRSNTSSATTTPPKTTPPKNTLHQDSERALALLEGRALAEPPAPASTNKTQAPRFVVQVAAFSDSASVKKARAKLEKAGLSHYTQEITNKGKKTIRLRIGPFNSESEAKKMLKRAQSLGFNPNLLEL